MTHGLSARLTRRGIDREVVVPMDGGTVRGVRFGMNRPNVLHIFMKEHLGTELNEVDIQRAKETFHKCLYPSLDAKESQVTFESEYMKELLDHKEY